MIRNFADRQTANVFRQEFSLKLPREVQKIALRKLLMMEAANGINDLRVPPGNHLEALFGDREGQYSIRINQQYRICFSVDRDAFTNVEIVDYH